MKKYLIAVIAIGLGTQVTRAQEFGLSFSYFVPKNGDFSTPISPFSFRGVGVNMGRHFALETGISLYRMSGLNMKDIPFESHHSLVGPNFTFFVPGELVIQFPANGFEFDIKGGGFVFYGVNQKLNYGNLDRALATREGWDVVNSQFSFDNSPGYGFHAGVELSVNVTKQFGVSLEVNYLMGASKLPLTGTYTGGTLGGTNETKNASFDDAKVDFTGLEVSIGVFMLSNNGPQRMKKRR
jgi:hypothetical protein